MQLIVYGAVSIHFAKRVLETLFLHKYSGKMAVQTLIFITFIYSLITGMICYLNTRTVPEMDTLFHIGVVLFFVGEAGNFYHHNLLADLRKGSEGYHIPQGGLFQYAACPHYFWSWFRGWVSYFCLVICLLFWHWLPWPPTSPRETSRHASGTRTNSPIIPKSASVLFRLCFSELGEDLCQ